MDDLSRMSDDDLFAYMRERKPVAATVAEGRRVPREERWDEYRAAMREAERRGFSAEEIDRHVWGYWKVSD